MSKRSKGGKRPSTAIRQITSKAITQSASPQRQVKQDEENPPSWRFDYLIQQDNVFGLGNNESAALEILNFISKIEHLKYNELVGGSSAFFSAYDLTKRETVSKLNKQAIDYLNSLSIDEDKLYRFRLSGKKRVFVVRRNSHQLIFDLVFYDPNHKVYPVEKKHT